VAALAEGRQELAAESADLLYHLLVLWAAAGVKPRDVWTQLAKREGVSGLAEKAARQSSA
jgi:phosphoribosyl-ATP pyrophosphohydrolase